MASPRPTSDDGSAYMTVDDEQSEVEEAEEQQLLGEGQEEGQGEEQEAESDEASLPSQVLEDEDSNGSSLAAARATTSNVEVLEQLDHLQDVSCVVVRAVDSVLSFYLLSSPSPPPTHPSTPLSSHTH